MTLFDDIIADGLTAAENAWGESFTIAGRYGTFTGTWDSRRDSAKPADGGYLPEITSSIVASITQFTETPLLLEQGGKIELEQGGTLETEFTRAIPEIGARLTIRSNVYLVAFVENDGHAITLGLKSVDQ